MANVSMFDKPRYSLLRLPTSGSILVGPVVPPTPVVAVAEGTGTYVEVTMTTPPPVFVLV